MVISGITTIIIVNGNNETTTNNIKIISNDNINNNNDSNDNNNNNNDDGDDGDDGNVYDYNFNENTTKIWTNDDRAYWRINVSHGLDELDFETECKKHIENVKVSHQ